MNENYVLYLWDLMNLVPGVFGCLAAFALFIAAVGTSSTMSMPNDPEGWRDVKKAWLVFVLLLGITIFAPTPKRFQQSVLFSSPTEEFHECVDKANTVYYNSKAE
jgi:hypothetical protein